MSIAHIIKGHEKDLGGGFLVSRYLPSVIKQAVGPFIFFDHFGPIDVPLDANHDVRPHPHIGLATVTYLFDGAMDHRDSIGTVQRIEPGAINWMTAGRGIVHSERTPADLKGRPHGMHGLQLWAALPRAHEEDAPGFSHTPAAAIPEVNVGAAAVRVLIGTAFGRTSPVPTYMPTLYLDVTLPAGAELELAELPAEAAVYPVEGSVQVDGVAVPGKTMALLDTARPQRIRAEAGAGAGTEASTGGGAEGGTEAGGAARFVVIGGAALDGHRFMFWNFVSSSKERIAQAADEWDADRFPKIPGETERIPLPNRPKPQGTYL